LREPFRSIDAVPQVLNAGKGGLQTRGAILCRSGQGQGEQDGKNA
jgi:hypothetical protein